jgi:pyruvyltransferase
MIKAWWYNKENNFGDILTPHLLNHFGKKFEQTSIENATSIFIGSIVRRATNNMNVYGSGIMFSDEKLNPNAKYHFVRGPLTRDRVIKSGGECPEIYGDPALLLPLFCDENKKKHDIGIVPHYVDYQHVLETYPNYKVINVLNENPLAVAKEISECRSIISSSLHGIIAANAYGIPAAWVKYSNRVKGDDVKFKDYFYSIGVDPVLSTMNDLTFLNGSVDVSKITNIFINI